MTKKRGPLRFILLADSGQDVNQCGACGYCYVDEDVGIKFDLELWEVLAAARQNEETALTNQTIWALSEARPGDVRCANGIDVVMIMRSLRREACRRGLAPRSEGVKRKT